MKDFIELAAKYFENFFISILRLLARPREFASTLKGSDRAVGDAMMFFVLSMMLVQFIRLPMFSGRPEIVALFAKDVTWKAIFFTFEALILCGLFRAFGGKGSATHTVVLSAYLFSIMNVLVHIGVLLAYSVPTELPCLSWENVPRSAYAPWGDFCRVIGQFDSGTLKAILYHFGGAIKAVYLLFGLAVSVWLFLAWYAYAEIHEISDRKANGALVVFVLTQPIMLGIALLLLIQSKIL
jgi:hypothetical protein